MSENIPDPPSESVPISPSALPPRIPDPAGWRCLRLIVDHNPCFLLSALCMFLGCFLLNSAMDVRAADVGKSLVLLATINVYELALIVLAFALLRKPGGRGRDAVLLLFVQMLFLADAPFLIAQLMQATTTWNWLLAVLFGALALVKAALVLRGVGIPVRGRTWGFLGLQLVLICGLPAWLSHVAVAGELSALTMYGVWWIVGLLPAVYELLARFEPVPVRSSRQEFLRRAYVIVPWLLLVAHAAFFHYIYRATFYMADLAPVMLGLAVASRRLVPTRLYPATQLRFVRLAMPVVALFFSMAAPEQLLNWSALSITISPAILTGAAGIIVYGYLVSLPAALWAVAAEALMAFGWAMSSEILASVRGFFEVSSRAASFSASHVPTSATAWGVMALIAGFVLLGVGAFWSLRARGEGTQTG